MKKFLVVISIVFAVLVIFLINNNKSSVPGGNSSTTYWVQTESGWKAVGTPPSCPEPLELDSITDISKATSVLYPGQMRSVGYEPTAGFRFDGVSNEEISVRAPIDGEIVYAARFLVGGELQYVFDILSPCGIMNKFDHLLVLPPKLQAIADKLPEPKENDSRSTPVLPPVKVIKGEVLATAIGLRKNNNSFISWTVFDFRQKNKVSKNPSWASDHPELYHYAICPFPYLPKKDQERIAILPAADYMSGKQSDFCN